MTPPRAYEIEVTVFGPGFGECILIHLGHNTWAIINSCRKSRSKKPAALWYLEKLGLNPIDCVKLILATHWHNDHIGGLSEVLSACKSARFAFPLGFNEPQFYKFMKSHAGAPIVDNGVSEIFAVFELLRREMRDYRIVTADFPLLSTKCNVTHLTTALTALSPSHPDVLSFIRYIGSKIPSLGANIGRPPAPKSNDLSVATWLQVGSSAALLGADLEERVASGGWSAVLASSTRPQGKASVFKAPHHGSSNGHHDKVWVKLLTPDVVAIVTPWNRNRGLPQRNDCVRIGRLASQSFVTSRRSNLTPRFGQTVTRALRDANIKIRRADSPTGRVTLRYDPKNLGTTWSIDRSENHATLAIISIVDFIVKRT